MTPPTRLLLLCLTAALPLTGLTAPAATHSREYRYSPTPAWVTPQNGSTAAATREQQSVEFLLVDDQIQLDPAPEEYRRRVLRPLTTVGVEEVSELQLRFNPAFQTLNIHQIQVRRGEEVRDLTRSARLRVVHREEQLGEGIQDGEATAIAILEDIRAGDIIDYSYSVSGDNPIFGQKRFGFIGLDGNSHVNKLTARLVSSRQRPLQVRPYNNPGIRVESRDLGADRREYRVTRESVAAVPFEEGTPAWFTPLSWLEYSEYADWPEVERWAQQLYAAEARKAGPLFDALYARLAKAASSPEDFITRALFAVQNEIRYLGLEFGENSHRPRSPETVLKNRYGDCKDKALLLSRLLQRHGLQAWPALVSTRFQKGIAGELPSPGLFDHVITRLEFQGRKYWLDGTRRYQGGALNDIGRQDLGQALVIGDSGNGLEKMYDTLPPLRTLSIEEHYYAQDFNGPVRLEMTTTFHGNAAESQREYFSNRPLTEIRKAWANFSSQYHDELRVLKPLEYEDDLKGNRFIVREYYQLDAFWKPDSEKDARFVKAPFVLAGYADILRAPNTVERRMPVQMPSPRTIDTRIYLHLPTDVDLKFDSKPVVTDTAAFRFSNIDRYFDRTYYNQSELVIKTPEVAPADFTTFQKTVRETRKQLDFTINIPRPDTAGYSGILTLKNQVNGWGGH